jgi:hypothetical protein
VGQHDLSYRHFFAHRRMIQNLLREIVGEQWVERIDLASGERVNTSFVSAKHENRESDVIWKVILPRFGLSEEEVSGTLTLEELGIMLAESIDRWNREIREEGRQEGRQEGEARLLLRLLRLKFGPLATDVEERVRSADAERLLDWGERLLTAESLQDVFQD